MENNFELKKKKQKSSDNKEIYFVEFAYRFHIQHVPLAVYCQ